MKAWVMGANINLPHDVSVTWAKIMPPNFHARFKAIDDVQRQCPTLRITGNLRGGIGMGDRIKQAFDEASYLVNLPVE